MLPGKSSQLDKWLLLRTKYLVPFVGLFQKSSSTSDALALALALLLLLLLSFFFFFFFLNLRPVNNTRFLTAVFGQLIGDTCVCQRQLLFKPLAFFFSFLVVVNLRTASNSTE